MAEKITLKSIANPKTRYGSGRTATRHFIVQRATGALGIVFTIFFIWLIVRLAGASDSATAGLLSNPIVAIVTGLLVISTALHMRIGMIEVIEDYVHDKARNQLSLSLNNVFCALIVIVALVSLVKLVFWG